MKAPHAHSFRRRIEAVAVVAGVGLLGRLPASAAQALGIAAACTAATLWPGFRRAARANLAWVFPDWSDERREALLEVHLAQLGRAAAEWARLPHGPPEQLALRVEFEGVEPLEQALARGRGAIIATGHTGCWELLLPALRTRLAGREVNAVGHSQRNPGLQRVIETRRRLGGGAPTLPQDASEILRALGRGAAVGVLADHYLSPRRGGRLVPFLGLRSWTNPGPATLALRAGCPLWAAHIHPTADGRQRVVLGPEIRAEAVGARGPAVASMTEHLNAILSEWIRARPELWLWSHRRFRGSPDVAIARAGEGAGDG